MKQQRRHRHCTQGWRQQLKAMGALGKREDVVKQPTMATSTRVSQPKKCWSRRGTTLPELEAHAPSKRQMWKKSAMSRIAWDSSQESAPRVMQPPDAARDSPLNACTAKRGNPLDNYVGKTPVRANANALSITSQSRTCCALSNTEAW